MTLSGIRFGQQPLRFAGDKGPHTKDLRPGTLAHLTDLANRGLLGAESEWHLPNIAREIDRQEEEAARERDIADGLPEDEVERRATKRHDDNLLDRCEAERRRLLGDA